MLSAFLFLIFPACTSESEDSEKPEEDPGPIRILVWGGGANHDYATQLAILEQGIEERIDREIEWTIRLDGSGRSDEGPSWVNASDWASGIDLVIHHHCYPRVLDSAYVEKAIAPHRAGLPAILLHGSLLSFTRAGEASDTWSKLAGGIVTGEKFETSVRFTAGPGGAIFAGLEREWAAPEGQLYLWNMGDSDTRILLRGAIEDAETEPQPVAWTHSFGPEQARIFASSIGNRATTTASPPFLDLLARAVVWCLDLEEPDERLVEVSAADSLPDLPLSPPRLSALRLGPSIALSGAAGAIPESAPGVAHPAQDAVDGDSETYWESPEPGPASWRLDLPKATQIEAVGISWRDRIPQEFDIEGSLGEGAWAPLASEIEHPDEGTSFLFVPQPSEIDRLRINFPSSRPGERIGIREVSTYEREDDIPAAFLVGSAPSRSWNTVAPTGWQSAIRLSDGWSIEEVGSVPEKIVPREWIETASGDLFVVSLSPDRENSTTIWRGSAGENGYDWIPFLESAAKACTAFWDGEWLTVIADGILTRYRDSSGDGRADERGPAVVLEHPGHDGTLHLRDARLAMDGYCYALAGFGESGEPPGTDMLVRYRQDGTGWTELLRGDRRIADYWIARPGRIYARFEGSQGNPFRVLPVHAPSIVEKTSSGSLDTGPKEAASNPQEEPPPPEEERIWYRRGDELWSFRAGELQAAPPALPVALIAGARAIRSPRAAPLVLLEFGEGHRIVRLARPDWTPARVELDRVTDSELPALLDHRDGQIRLETIFEILRRRRDLAPLVAKAASDFGPEGRAALLGFSANQEPGLSRLTQAARSSDDSIRRLAFALLDGRSDAKQLPVYREILETRDPETTAAILGCLHRTNTSWEEIEGLCLSWAGHMDPVLSGTARSYLRVFESERLLREALNDPGHNDAARKTLKLWPIEETLDLRWKAIDAAEDAKARRDALERLCAAYPRLPEGSRERKRIEDLLRQELSRGRFRPEFVLEQFERHDIPRPPLDWLVDLARDELSLEPHVLVRFREADEIPTHADGWLEEIVASESRDPDLRLRALGLLLRSGGRSGDEASDLLHELLASDPRSDQRTRWISHWGAVVAEELGLDWLLGQAAHDPASTRSLLAWEAILRNPGAWQNEPEIDRVRKAVDSALENDEDRREALVAVFERTLPTLASGSIDLPDSGESDPDLEPASRVLQRALTLYAGGGSSQPPAATPSTERISRWAEALADSGGASTPGWKLFRRSGCAVCHNIHGEGERYGPDIVDFVASTGPAEFLQALYLTDERIMEEYRSTRFELRNGRTILASVVGAGKKELNLRDAAGNPFTLPKSRIHLQWPDAGSLMPVKAGPDWGEEELGALRAFLLKLSSREDVAPAED